MLYDTVAAAMHAADVDSVEELFDTKVTREELQREPFSHQTGVLEEV